MVLELIRKHSNARWINNGTLYGASRYSFVSITSQLSRLENFNFLVSNVMAMYYKMVELCLLQRASILRFSNEVTKISRLTNEKNLPKRVSSLYKEYIRFVNKIYFREVTAQEQGIELYDLLQKHMRIEQQVKDLDGEINELHEYVMMQEEAARNNKLDRISYLGAGFLIPTFMLSMYALSSDDPMAIRIWAVFSVIPALLAFVSGKKWHIFFLVVLMAMIVIGLIILK
jgi:Mg2+ and Co2+ transporter CorA